MICLYVSRAMSAWGDKMWRFTIPTVFMMIFHDTLLPSAVYELSIYVLSIQCMPLIGRWVDLTHRLTVQRIALTIQNMCILISCSSICAMLIHQCSIGIDGAIWDGAFISLFLIVAVSGAIGELMYQAQTLSIERDWVVVIARSKKKLGDINTLMRRIDLSCKVLAPAGVGFMVDSLGMSASREKIFYGALVIGIWNLFDYPIELIMNTYVFYAYPRLEHKLHEHAGIIQQVKRNDL